MDPLVILQPLLEGQDVAFKIVLLIFMLLYSLFALILLTQIKSLITSINQTSFSPILRLFAYGNVVASILAIGYTILTF